MSRAAVTEFKATTELQSPGGVLRAYLLGTLEFDRVLALQRRLLFDVSGEPATGSLIICDHPPGITVGREGSRADVRLGPAELQTRSWSVRWVSRGGGTMLHVPGQVACYPILSLESRGLTVGQYVNDLLEVGVEMIREQGLSAVIDLESPGVRVNGRRIVHIGVAVRDTVTCFGLVVNVEPDLALFREVCCDGDPLPMTSIQRESSTRVRIQSVRQRLVELVAARFGFAGVSIFHTHSAVAPQPKRYVAAHGS